MTDRIPLDHLTSDALDALYERVTVYRAAWHSARGRAAHQRCINADLRTELAAKTNRAERAEAALARVQHVAALIEAGAPWTANQHETAARIRAAIAEPAPAVTEGTGNPKTPPVPTVTTGLVVQPYRDDHNRPRWVFRCWGTDTCDGWLSLDHHTQQSAERARDRHVSEEHGQEQPGA